MRPVLEASKTQAKWEMPESMTSRDVCRLSEQPCWRRVAHSHHIAWSQSSRVARAIANLGKGDLVPDESFSRIVDDLQRS